MRNLLITLFSVFSFVSLLPAQESLQKLYRIRTDDFSRIKNIESKGVTVYQVKPGSYIEIMALPEQIRNLAAEGLEAEFIADSFRELYQDQLSLKSIPPFHGYQGTLNELNRVVADHPDIVRLDTIGFSVQGRAIVSLKISDNPDANEDEIPILLVGNHHGNEVHSVEAVLHEINFLTDNYGTDPEVTNWVHTMEIWCVPMTNPDGREALTRSNNHGVDLNRNYSFGYTPGGNHGPSAFSEPETRALRDLAAKFPPVMSLTYHTSGQYLLYSWTHTDEAAPDSAAMIYLGNLISQAITIPGGHYELRQGGRWYFTAGEYCDFMYTTHNTMAFTVEMGISQAPDYSVIPEMVAVNLNGMKAMFRQAFRAGVTGTVTDTGSGLPVIARIEIPSINDQGKLPARYSDSLYGRYYRYLEPGSYIFRVSAPGYKTLNKTITVSPDSLTPWNITMEREAFLALGEVSLNDKRSGTTSGNGDGFINPGETVGLTFSLVNEQPADAKGIYAKVKSMNENVRMLTDSLYFGTIPGNAPKFSSDTILFRIDSQCHDGEDLELLVSIGDEGGFSWFPSIHLEAYAPKLGISGVKVDDAGGNGNGSFDNGETATVEVSMINDGRQAIHDVTVLLNTDDTFFQITEDQSEAELMGAGEEWVFRFFLTLASDAPANHIADFRAGITSSEGYSNTLSFQLNNLGQSIGETGHLHRAVLHDCYPSPFGSTTSISYTLPDASSVELTVYDQNGNRISTLVSGDQAAGHYICVWDRTGSGSSRVAPGVYFYQLRAGDHVATKRMVVVQ